jgi:hypothetical protein
MTPGTSETTNLDLIFGARNEETAGYVYEYVYGEKREIRTTGSSGRAERRAAETWRASRRRSRVARGITNFQKFM